MADLYVPNIKPPAPANIGSGSVIYGAGAPTAPALPGTLYIDNVGNTQYFTTNGTTWVSVSGSGGGGTSNDSQGTVDPSAAPTDPTKTAYYTNLTSGLTFVWNVTTQAWQ